MRVFLVLLFLLIPGFSFGQNWQEIKSDHFILFYLPVSPAVNSGVSSGNIAECEDFSKDVLHKAELYYERIAEDLGYQRSSGFWTWDKRVKIYIYPDKAGFSKVSDHPEWAAGVADYNTKTIISYLGNKDFAQTILPHEIAHLIFRDFVGFKGEIPLWLDEGVAQWTETEKRQQVMKLVKEMFRNNGLLTIEDMMTLAIKNIKNGSKVFIRPTRNRDKEKSVLFLSGDNLIAVYYAQSVSLVGFLIEKFGKVEFTNFCRALRDGKGVEESLVAVYSPHIRNLTDFDDQWREYLENEL